MTYYLVKVQYFLSAAVLFFLPLIFWPSPLKFELPKVVFFLSLTFFLLVYLLIKGSFEKNQNKAWFLWIGLLFLSALLNKNLVNGLIGFGYRHQGIIFFLSLGIWAWAFTNQTKAAKKRINQWVALSVIFESVIVFGQWLATNAGTPPGTFGEPNLAAGFLVMGVPSLLQTLSPFFLFLPIAAIIATGSKVAFGALLGQALVFWYLKQQGFPRKKLLIIFSVLVIFISGIFGVWQQKNISPFENRFLIWSLGAKAALNKPFFGYGPEGIVAVYERQFQKINRPLEQLVVDRSHNLWLDIILISGLAGLLTFLGWFWENTRKIKEGWKIASLVGFLIFSFFQPLGVVHWVYLIFLLSN